MVKHSYKYTPVIQLLEIHPFSSQHGDVDMKLYPCSNYPGQKVTVASHGGSSQSRNSSECPHMPPARFRCGLCRSILAWWHCDTGLWGFKTSSQLCGGLPELLKLSVMDRDLPLSSQCDYFLQKNSLSPLKFQATQLASCWYCHYVTQLSKKFSPSSSHSLMKDVISPSVCQSSRRMGMCLIIWHTKISSWERKPWQGWTGSQKEK